MKTSIEFGKRRNGWPDGIAVCAILVLAACFAPARSASAQTVPDADQGGTLITAGGTASGAYIQYGERKMIGATAFVDVDTRRKIGVEGEARFIDWNQTADFHAETYSIGGRYHVNLHRFQPYAKGLIGFGYVNFPYNGGTGNFLVITAGGGMDYRLKGRIYLRIADAEYQAWPQFSYGLGTMNMTTATVSSGIRVRIF